MRLCVLLFLTSCILWASVLHADVCVKRVIHYDEYYSHGVATPASDVEIEIWFGEKRMACHGGEWIGVIDTGKNLLYFARTGDSVYFEFPLPVVCRNHVTEELDQTLDQYFIAGAVEKQPDEKTILDHRCSGFSCKNDITFEDNHFYDAEKTAWITDEVSFDWTLWNEMNNAIRRFFRPRDEYMKELDKLKGFEMAAENKRYDRGDVITTRSEVVEITEREAPEGTYSVPGGFSKKDLIERRELISLRGIIYY